MRRRLEAYGSKAQKETITPWALVEPEAPSPSDPAERQALFGEVSLGLLYSGTFGRGHSWRGTPELARALAPSGGKIVFSVQGNAVEQLRRAMQEAEAPVGFAPTAPSHTLQTRLSAADVHIVSLREEWTGMVVPSKFFGALAIGRPVLFVGSASSAIAKWIEQMGVGWVLDLERIEALAAELSQWAQSPKSKASLFAHCHAVYQREFSQCRAVDCWDRALRALLSGCSSWK